MGINKLNKMKSVIALLIVATAAVRLEDGPAFFNEPPHTEKSPSSEGFVQVSACSGSGIDGVMCTPQNQMLFATGMNGDEDLAEDITMKGDKFHYIQKAGDDLNDPEKVSTLDPKIAKTHTTFYNQKE